ncbi:MAG TPA: hypothetical protein VFY29_20685 [Terriglobia bacterium]|nr:hypothetical protein [Terriglobia bacterium]
MNFLKLRFSAMVCLLLAGVAATACQSHTVSDAATKEEPKAKGPAKSEHREYNDVARFLAGLPPEEGSRLEEASARPAFVKYAASFDKNWIKLNKSKLDAMKQWASQEMPEVSHASSTLFYPFSGPDFLHAYTFFPGSERYALIALEPVGSVPKVETMTPDAMDQLFASVDRSLDSVLSFSFFKTDNMKVDLKKELDGTLPILMIFLARTNNRIMDIHPVEIDASGKVVPASAPSADNRPVLNGVEIVFQTDGKGPERRLEYFSVNLQNDYLKQSPAFVQYVENLGNVNTYLKSASYLMYKAYFSTIRKTILDHSAFVLEDDSAIPFKYFEAADWDVELYGVYSQPIEMFKEHQQPDLAAAYRKPGAAKPLTFGIGYSWRPGQSNLLAAKRKG